MIDNHTYQHSFEVQEIIGKTPTWMVRWGIIAFSVTICLLLLLSMFIIYPVTARYPVNILLDAPLQYIIQSGNETISFKQSTGQITGNATVAVALADNGQQHTITAAYTGIIVPIKSIKSDGPATPDTLAIIIPQKAGYTFNGSLPARLIKPSRQAIRVKLLVQENNLTGNTITLQGDLTEMSPIAINGNCTFSGILSPSSNRQLANDITFTPACKGMLEIKLSEKSLFATFMEKTFRL
ncbi:hypothetical protein CLV51_101812 [Chitinophaga niastensis]|uniref:HlyD family secretion protein n=1 Tax=Chitinophaga niastensis TaxID=536980 RepID=A0A2P8HTC0_CHINA|nr:hypothetical protein [Chitinophaga niastensis]PSL49479.1 hypothetical protein CLV51_101812 [Chitinophaga niastensis]